MTLEFSIQLLTTATTGESTWSRLPYKDRIARPSHFKETVENRTTIDIDELSDIFPVAIPAKGIFSYFRDKDAYEGSLRIRQRIEERRSSTDVIDSSPVNIYQRRMNLIYRYISGDVDIPELVEEFKMNSEGDVVVALERMGVYRDVIADSMSAEEEHSILTKLANIAKPEFSDVLNSVNRIRREVVASQRIESVIVEQSDFE